MPTVHKTLIRFLFIMWRSTVGYLVEELLQVHFYSRNFSSLSFPTGRLVTDNNRYSQPISTKRPDV